MSNAYDTAKDCIEVHLPDEPGIHITTGRGEIFHLIDGGRIPDMSDLGAAVLVTRLRWWADHIENRKRSQKFMAEAFAAETTEAGQ